MAEKLQMTLGLTKATDNKFVFGEVRDENDPFAESRVSGLYLSKTLCKTIGMNADTPRLRVTIEPIQ